MLSQIRPQCRMLRQLPENMRRSGMAAMLITWRQHADHARTWKPTPAGRRENHPSCLRVLPIDFDDARLVCVSLDNDLPTVRSIPILLLVIDLLRERYYLQRRRVRANLYLVINLPCARDFSSKNDNDGGGTSRSSSRKRRGG